MALHAPLVACGGGDSTKHVEVDDRSCAVPSLCDFTRASCERALLSLTACVRGDETPPLPSVRVITQSKLRSELTAAAADMGSGPTPWDTAFEHLGLIAMGGSSVDVAIDQEVQSVAAYYDEQKKDITVIQPSMPQDRLTQMYELSHEFTHYLQDRSDDLGALRKEHSDSTDQGMALTSLVEGDAVVNSTRVAALLDGAPIDGIDWDRFHDDMLKSVLMDAASSSSPLFPIIEELPYPVGERYLADAWNSQAREGVEALLAKPPSALVDMLDGYEPDASSLIEPLDCAPPLPPAGSDFVVYGTDGLGVAGALALLTSAPDINGGDSSDDFALASKLRADMIAVYALGAGSTAPVSPVLVAWRLRFADDASATDVWQRASMLGAVLPGLSLASFGRELLIAVGDGGTSWSLDDLQSCPDPGELMPPSDSGVMAIVRSLPHP